MLFANHNTQRPAVPPRPNQEIAPLSDTQFEQFRGFAYSECGLCLHPAKKALISSRLERVIKRNGWGSFAKYIQILASKRGTPEWTEFIDCLTTNHTGFFREMEHFSFLQKEIFPKSGGKLRLWSSACATGEEPYSIAISATEAGLNEVEILATDISSAALAAAAKGTYEESRLLTVPTAYRGRYMVLTESKLPRIYRVVDKVRQLIRFQPINLLKPMVHLPRFDVVFCRNVMIYFDRPTQSELVAKLAERIVPGGYLFTGHSETLLTLPGSLTYVQPAIYRKNS